ncbi:MAG: ABC transporter ATP-binding protein [Alphaproteobacteria bacterium]
MIAFNFFGDGLRDAADPYSKWSTSMTATPLLKVENLTISLEVDHTLLPIAMGVNFTIQPGKVFALVGESGSGKTIVALSILRLLGKGVKITGGKILFSRDGKEPVDIAALNPKGKDIQRLRAGQIGMIFQEPMSSFSPVHTIGNQIEEVIRLHLDMDKAQARAYAIEMLGKVGITAPARVVEVAKSCGLSPDQLSRYPHAFSGGQRQRISIARALVMRPEFIICDEPVSALDVSIQAQILNLLIDQQKELGLTLLFISHDLVVVAYICDRIAVMYLGNIVEIAPTKQLFQMPLHPYTETLMAAIPSDDPDHQLGEAALAGEATDMAGKRSGCLFRARWRHADGDKCTNIKPPLVAAGPGRMVACHYADALTLTGFDAERHP